MIYADALRILGLTGTPTPEQVKAAFRVKAKSEHPDHGVCFVYSISELMQARDCLIKGVPTRAQTCDYCRGTGRVPQGLGTTSCPKGCTSEA